MISDTANLSRHGLDTGVDRRTLNSHSVLPVNRAAVLTSAGSSLFIYFDAARSRAFSGTPETNFRSSFLSAPSAYAALLTN